MVNRPLLHQIDALSDPERASIVAYINGMATISTHTEGPACSFCGTKDSAFLISARHAEAFICGSCANTVAHLERLRTENK